MFQWGDLKKNLLCTGRLTPGGRVHWCPRYYRYRVTWLFQSFSFPLRRTFQGPRFTKKVCVCVFPYPLGEQIPTLKYKDFRTNGPSWKEISSSNPWFSGAILVSGMITYLHSRYFWRWFFLFPFGGIWIVFCPGGYVLGLSSRCFTMLHHWSAVHVLPRFSDADIPYIPCLKLTVCPWKWMVGTRSFWVIFKGLQLMVQKSGDHQLIRVW